MGGDVQLAQDGLPNGKMEIRLNSKTYKSNRYLYFTGHWFIKTSTGCWTGLRIYSNHHEFALRCMLLQAKWKGASTKLWPHRRWKWSARYAPPLGYELSFNLWTHEDWHTSFCTIFLLLSLSYLNIKNIYISTRWIKRKRYFNNTIWTQYHSHN